MSQYCQISGESRMSPQCLREPTESSCIFSSGTCEGELVKYIRPPLSRRKGIAKRRIRKHNVITTEVETKTTTQV